MPDFVFSWDQALRNGAGGYRAPNGRIVSNQAARESLDAYLDASQDVTASLSDSLRNGRISLADWQQQRREVIKLNHLNAAAAEVGGYSQMTPADFGRAGQKIRVQYEYLDNFAAQIADGTQPLDGRFMVRDSMYDEAALNTYDAFQTLDYKNAGWDEHRSVLETGQIKHCQGCIDEAAKGWVKIDGGGLKPLGTRDCLTRDRCTKRYRNSETGQTDGDPVQKQMPNLSTRENIREYAISVGYDVDLDGLSLEQSQAIGNAIRRVDERFTGSYRPGVGKFQAGDSGGSLRSAYVGSGRSIRIVPDNFSGDALGLNEKRNVLASITDAKNGLASITDEFEKELALKRIARYERKLARIEGSPPWMVGETLDDIIIHEIGHVIQDDLSVGSTIINGIIDFRAPSELREMGIEFADTLAARLDSIAKSEGLKLGEYATTNSQEYFAESFAAFMRGEEDKINADLLAIFRRLL